MQYANVNTNERSRFHKNYIPAECVSIFLLLVFSCFYSLISSWINSGITKYMIIAFSVAFIIILKINEFKFIPRFVDIRFLIWFIFMVYALFSDNTFVYRTYGLLVCFASVFIINFLLLTHCDWIQSFYTILLTLTLIHVIVTILSFLIPSFYIALIRPLINGAIKSGEGYKAGLNAHYSSNSMYLALCSVVSFTRYHTCRKRIYIIIWATSLTALLLLAKRGLLIAAICAYIIVYLVHNRLTKIKSFWKLWIGILIVVCIIFIVSPNIPQLIAVTKRFSGNDITNGRMPLYELAWTLFKENPVWGIGWGNFGYRFVHHSANLGLFYGSGLVLVHNVYLQVLCETGIIGEMLFLFLVFSTFAKSIRLHKQSMISEQQTISEYLLLSIGVQVVFFVNCNTGNPFYDPQVLFPYALSCGVVYSIHYGTLAGKTTFLPIAKAKGIQPRQYDDHVVA